MEKPECKKRAPYYVDVEEGKTYFWCPCGKSSKDPFCDGSHKGGPFKPVKWVAEKSENVELCGCKRTKSPPYCDGSHCDLS